MALDRAFSERVADRGTADAFAEFAAPDGTVYRNGFAPARGPEAIRERLAEDAPGLFRWLPSEATVAASADLGVTRGRFTYQVVPPGQPDAPLFHGFYVIVWAKQLDGAWKYRDFFVTVVNPAPAGEAPVAP